MDRYISEVGGGKDMERWEVLQGKIWITYCLQLMIVSRTCVYKQDRIIMMVDIARIIPNIIIDFNALYITQIHITHMFHTWVCILSRNLNPAQVLPAGHVPLGRILRLTPED